MASHQWNGVQYEDLLSITNLLKGKEQSRGYATCSKSFIVLFIFLVVHKEEPLYNFRSYHSNCLYQAHARTCSLYNLFVHASHNFIMEQASTAYSLIVDLT